MATGLPCCRHPENVAYQFLRESNRIAGGPYDSLSQMNFDEIMKNSEKK